MNLDLQPRNEVLLEARFGNPDAVRHVLRHERQLDGPVDGDDERRDDRVVRRVRVVGVEADVVQVGVLDQLRVGRVGFEIPTVLLLVFWLKLLGGESWRVTASVSVLTTAALYLIFVVLLSAPLPRLSF